MSLLAHRRDNGLHIEESTSPGHVRVLTTERGVRRIWLDEPEHVVRHWLIKLAEECWDAAGKLRTTAEGE